MLRQKPSHLLIEFNKRMLESLIFYRFDESHCLAIQGKLRFTQFGTRFIAIETWLSLDLFLMFTQLSKFYTFHCHRLKSTDV